MKRLIIIAMIAAMALSITACGTEDTTNSSTSTTVEETVAETTVAPTTVAPTTVEMTVLESKKVKLPKSIVGDTFSLDVTAEEKEKGILSKVDDGDYYTVEIDGSLYNQLIDSLKKSTSETLDSLPENEAYKSIEKVEYSDNFEEIKIYVDKALYESNKLDSMSMFAAGVSALIYQEYYNADDTDKSKTVVSIIDKDSKEELNRVTYPDDLNN